MSLHIGAGCSSRTRSKGERGRVAPVAPDQPHTTLAQKQGFGTWAARRVQLGRVVLAVGSEALRDLRSPEAGHDDTGGLKQAAAHLEDLKSA